MRLLVVPLACFHDTDRVCSMHAVVFSGKNNCRDAVEVFNVIPRCRCKTHRRDRAISVFRFLRLCVPLCVKATSLGSIFLTDTGKSCLQSLHKCIISRS